ncbi:MULTISPECIES: hypothetical protein [Ramlibacter]|uniref:Uncharacterized protein n=1 Tax=Ramlibacter pinisoli TaxID=2682844 RepID=A0A6N8J1F7_9BURK|nr:MULTISPECIES: hypothetical protein [Ramlibacter]MBA2962063.1 hypothetical protein [Ramlibacter sp. CGMCC 1.13660]MVQ32006.1 hypothetical protein [Ramlibacter pinisoli]
MSTTTITDLPLGRALGFKAMSFIRGAVCAPWVFGAYCAFLSYSPRIGATIHFFAS